MIQPFHSKFLTPTKYFRRLNVLLAVNNDPSISQHRIGKIVHLSSSMVNNYIKEFQQEGLINVEGNTNRTQSYHITKSGENELLSLLLSYSSEIIRLYTSAKYEVSERLDHLYTEGFRKIALFGAAETAEVVHAALKDGALEIKGIVDSDPNKHGQAFNGFIIQPPEYLKQLSIDAVVITSFAKQEEIYRSIKNLLGEGIKVKRLSDI